MLEAFVSKKRDRKAALKFLRKLMKRYPRPDAIITDRLRSYRAALRELGESDLHQAGRWLNNRAAVPATRTRDVPFQVDAKPPEICRRPFCRLPPLQPPTTSLLTGQLRAQAHPCTRPVASARGGLIPCRQRRTQTC